MLIGIAIEIPFALGEALLGFEAYFIRDWTTLQIVAYLPLLCENIVASGVFSITLHYSSAAWSLLGSPRICALVDWSRQIRGGEGNH